MSLFSIFEPQSFFILPLNWAVLGLTPFLLPVGVWCRSSEAALSFKNLAFFVKTEFKAISQPFRARANLVPGVTLFTVIVITNFLGLLPYVSPISGHLPFAVTLALPLWLGHVLYSWASQPIRILAHLVPTGSPGALIPFIVVIELVRSIIRPLTLSVRLVANIVAGHLLLTLLSSARNSGTSILVCTLVVSCLIVLSCLETAVATIQAYVFSVLSTLYLGEVDSCQITRKVSDRQQTSVDNRIP